MFCIFGLQKIICVRTFSLIVPATTGFSSAAKPFIINTTKMGGSNNDKANGVIHNWDLSLLTPQSIKGSMDTLVERLNGVMDQVGQVPLGEVGVDNVLKPIIGYNRWFFNDSTLLWFPSYVATKEEVREASRDAKKVKEEALIQVGMKVDVFKRLEALEGKEKKDMDGEYQRVLKKIIGEGKRNGLHLDPSLASEIKSLRTRLSELSVQYEKNVAEDKTTVSLTKEELQGVPESTLSIYDKEGDRFLVTMKYPHILPILKFCQVGETRKRIHIAKTSVAKEENTKIIEEMVDIRDKLAKLLGFKNHAAYVLDDLMAKSPEKVDTFLRDLAKKVTPLWKKEREEMEKLKREECERNEWNYTPLQLWDATYYGQKVEEKFYSLEKEKYKPYFPLDHVTTQMFRIYEGLLHSKISEVEGPVPSWAEGVKMYVVHDSRDDHLMGYFFLDLFPRDGKFTHFCCEQIQYSCVNEETGERVPSIIAMLCNFSLPVGGGGVSLLDHDEVETYFHEFGHLMHSMCARTKTAYLSGAPLDSCSGVERDFVEAPSQMLENWVWHGETLKMMSKHVETGDPLPDDMIEKLIKARNVNEGYFNLRQIVFSLFDQQIHSLGKCCTATLFGEIMKELLDLEVLPNTNFAASFGHLARQYDAKYYSYLWSQVFSADMFETGFGGKDNVLSPEKGLKYRQLILEPSGTVDAEQMLRNFLGRDPTPDAFLKMKGISESQ